MDRRTKLIELLDEARSGLLAAERRTRPRTQVAGEWSMKEVLAHVAAWDEASLPPLRALAEAEKLPDQEVLDIESYNAQVASECAQQSYEQVVARWQRAREQLKAEIARMPQEGLDQKLVFPWGREGTAADMVAALALHEREHADEIQGLIAGQ